MPISAIFCNSSMFIVPGILSTVNLIPFFITPSTPITTRRNLCKWSISQSAACSFCLQSEPLHHVVSSCKSYLEDGRYTWRHNSVLLCLAKTFPSFSDCLLYADLPSFLSPSVITGDFLRPDLVFISKNSILYILELTVGFESNIQINSDRKASKYSSLILDLKHTYSDVKFVNLSMSTIGIMGKSSESLLLMLMTLLWINLLKIMSLGKL